MNPKFPSDALAVLLRGFSNRERIRSGSSEVWGRASVLTDMGIKPDLWRRQHELRSAKMHIDTSYLGIGITAFDNPASPSTIEDTVIS